MKHLAGELRSEPNRSSPGESDGRPSPLLSVVIPVRAQKQLLMGNVTSLATSSSVLEIVVVENGSNELRIQELQGLAPDLHVRLLHRSRADLSEARNAGLDVARGRYVLFLDADDRVDVAGLERMAARSEIEGIHAVAVGMARLADQADPAVRDPAGGSDLRSARSTRAHEVIPGSLFLIRELLTNRYSPVTGSYLFEREWLIRLGLRFSPGFLHEDHAFVGAALVQAGNLLVSRRVLFLKRDHDRSITRTMSLGDSIAGYAEAAKALRAINRDRAALHPRSRAAIAALVVRLDFILARKRFRLSLDSPSVTRWVGRAAGVQRAGVRLLLTMALTVVARFGSRASMIARFATVGAVSLARMRPASTENRGSSSDIPE